MYDEEEYNDEVTRGDITITQRNWRGEIVEVQYEQLFLGSCKGIALVKRGENDPHVCFLQLTEDDGQWFASDSSFSSFWAFDFLEQINNAIKWMEENCIKEQHGYVFR